MDKTYYVELLYIKGGKYGGEYVEKRIVKASSEIEAIEKVASWLCCNEEDSFWPRKVEEKISEKPIIFDRWNYPEKDGWPADRQLCMVVWRTHDGDEDVFVGGYRVEQHDFWINWGAGGGLVLDCDSDIIRWCDLRDFNL